MLDDTLIYYIIGDNGASAEGTLNGGFNEMANFNGLAALEMPEFLQSKIDELGSPSAYNHYSVGWAMRCAPRTSGPNRSRRTGVAPATARSCTGRTAIEDGGGLRTQFARDRCCADDPRSGGGTRTDIVDGVTQSPIEGTTMLYGFNDARAAERHICSTSRCSPTAASITKAGAR